MNEDRTTTVADLTALTLAFRAERDWQQFHTPKELALCLTLESAEVLELMQWRSGEALGRHLAANQQALADELSDVLHAVLLLAHDQGIELASAYRAKMTRNAAKYPVEKSRGRSTKYSDL